MLEATHEVGAQEANFAHTVLHSGTPDLALSEAQIPSAVLGVNAPFEHLAVNGNLCELRARSFVEASREVEVENWSARRTGVWQW